MKINSLLYKILVSTLLALTFNSLLAFKQSTSNFIPIYNPHQDTINDSLLIDASSSDDIDTTSNDVDTTVDTTSALPPKPAPLDPVPLVDLDPLSALDTLVTKQYSKPRPYIPFLQEIFVGLDYGKLGKNMWHVLRKLKNKHYDKEQQYEASLGILLRNNIQLSANLGYAHLYPSPTFEDKTKYEVRGPYGRIGIDYVMRYDDDNNFYIGLRYGGSHFTNQTEFDHPQSKITSKLEASWFEVVIGGETKLWKRYGFYAGTALRINNLHRFTKLASTNNYIIPGYGKAKINPSIGLTLYIQYNLSFVNRLITL